MSIPGIAKAISDGVAHMPRIIPKTQHATWTASLRINA
jgi:hypothetical protein